MSTVRGKRVIVTGGANGIGLEYCHNFLFNGAKTVAILDLSGANGATSAKKLNEEFGKDRALFFPADVSKHEEFEVAFRKAVHALGGLDILINNAGILDDARWEKEIQINFTGLVNSTLLGFDVMGKHKGGNGGVIVNISSIVGLVPQDILPVYSATKHAVIAFTVSLKNHYEHTGITVRVMCPGVTDTPLIYDSQNKYLNFVDCDHAYKVLSGYPRQPADNVAKAMIQLIEKGVNGSVWVSQCSQPPLDIKLPEYKSVVL